MKNLPPIEWILLAFSFIITGIAILFIFKPPTKNYVKLIKWSPESNVEAVLENSARRMFPILAESRSLKIFNSNLLEVTPSKLSLIFQKISGLNFTVDSRVDDYFIINETKVNNIKLTIKGSKIDLGNTEITKYFDSLKLEKIINKIKSNKYKDKNLIFSLYQNEKFEYTLEILSI